MSRGRPVVSIELSEAERAYLTSLSGRRSGRADMKQRADIVLACADGLSNKVVGERLTVGQHTVGKWRRRFDAHRLDGLYDEPRPGGPRSISDEQVQQIVECTLHETPKVQNLL